MAGSHLRAHSASGADPRALRERRRRSRQLRAPLLFFHGDRDEIVVYELGRRLFDAAPEPKQFETIHGAGHNDTVEIGGRTYFERIARFVDEVAPEPGGS